MLLRGFTLYEVIAERQSVRRINDALGRFYSTLVYVRIFVCNAHIVTLGKDRHIHIRIYACAHGHCTEMETGETDKAGKRESATEYFRLVERRLLLQFVQATTDEYNSGY